MLYEEDDYAFKLDAKSIRNAFKDVVWLQALDIQKEYKLLTSKWSKSTLRGGVRGLKSSVVRRKLGRGTGMLGEKGTVYCATGVDHPYCVINFLDAGTKNRYRGMSYDWVSKTRSGAGISTFSSKGTATENWDENKYKPIGARGFRDHIISMQRDSYDKLFSRKFYHMLAVARWT